MFGLGAQELLIILLIVILLFGATRIPQIGSAIGKSISNFKRAVKGEDGDQDQG
jgi:sec-independent protein translocase protein TatA